jgi:HlyD family secretion protein
MSARPASVWRRRLAWLLALLIVLAVGGWWRFKPADVDGVQVRLRPLSRTLQFTARVKTPARVDVGATVTGRVDKVLVREGDLVQAGAPLVQLESDELRATLAQAQATYMQTLGRSNSQQFMTLRGAEAALAQAEANLLAAERDMGRTADLVAAKFYSQARLDEAQRAVDVARAQRDSAHAQVQSNAVHGGEQVAAQAQVDAARAAVDVAQAKLNQATLRAPGPGRVLARNVEPGQIVQAGKGLLAMSVDGPVELLAQVDERFLAQLKVGQRAKVLADAFPQSPFDARLDRLAPGVNAQSGSVDVTFVVDKGRPPFLREDMTLSVEAVTGERASARVLPLKAMRLVSANDKGRVLIAQDGRAVARDVKLGLRTLEDAEITAGLADGDVVILDAAVVEGTRVRVRARSAGGSP